VQKRTSVGGNHTDMHSTNGRRPTLYSSLAAGTAVGDFISGRNMLGLPVSTAVTGALFIALLVIWREQSRSERESAIAS
jgi:hypothetical protein